jgi:hypothetical protein
VTRETYNFKISEFQQHVDAEACPHIGLKKDPEAGVCAGSLAIDIEADLVQI